MRKAVIAGVLGALALGAIGACAPPAEEPPAEQAAEEAQEIAEMAKKPMPFPKKTCKEMLPDTTLVPAMEPAVTVYARKDKKVKIRGKTADPEFDQPMEQTVPNPKFWAKDTKTYIQVNDQCVGMASSGTKEGALKRLAVVAAKNSALTVIIGLYEDPLSAMKPESKSESIDCARCGKKLVCGVEPDC